MMHHVLEPATTGRSKCKACGRGIAKDALRFGERLPNPFADGDMTWWFHPACAAYRRPQAFLDAGDVTAALPDLQRLEAEARRGIEHHRLPRIAGVERAPSARARCRACREPIAKDAWRIPLVTFEEGMFNPAGNIHVGCSAGYFGTADILARLEPYTIDLSAEEFASLKATLASSR